MRGDIDRAVLTLRDAVQERGIRVAAAESCTGGMISAAITQVPGSSHWFDRGFVVYQDAAKSEMLGVNPEILIRYGAVSAQVASEMVQGALANSQARAAVSVTGLAGPGSDGSGLPVGLVFFGFSADGTERVMERHFTGDRRAVREAATVFALEELARLIREVM